MTLTPADQKAVELALREGTLEDLIELITVHPEIAAVSYPEIADKADRLTDALGALEERIHAKH